MRYLVFILITLALCGCAGTDKSSELNVDTAAKHIIGHWQVDVDATIAFMNSQEEKMPADIEKTWRQNIRQSHLVIKTGVIFFFMGDKVQPEKYQRGRGFNVFHCGHKEKFIIQKNGQLLFLNGNLGHAIIFNKLPVNEHKVDPRKRYLGEWIPDIEATIALTGSRADDRERLERQKQTWSISDKRIVLAAQVDKDPYLLKFNYQVLASHKNVLLIKCDEEGKASSERLLKLVLGKDGKLLMLDREELINSVILIRKQHSVLKTKHANFIGTWKVIKGMTPEDAEAGVMKVTFQQKGKYISTYSSKGWNSEHHASWEALEGNQIKFTKSYLIVKSQGKKHKSKRPDFISPWRINSHGQMIFGIGNDAMTLERIR